MIVSHNLENPKKVGSLITSTIVDTDGKKLDNYNKIRKYLTKNFIDIV